MSSTIILPNLLGDLITTKVNPVLSGPQKVVFDFGHYREIVRTLTEKDKAMTPPQKYPLIWLVLDMEEKVNTSLSIYATVSAHIIIAMDTKPELTAKERLDQVFIPILYPIYNTLIDAIKNSKYLNNSLPALMKHSKWDRFFWGGQDSNGNSTANLFNDFIDAIQIKGLELNIKKQFCEQFSI